jgi:hypothetical protein
MNAKTWTVDVDGIKYGVVVDQDAQSGRATIRVNGRIAAKPMSAEESEREVPIGSARYVVRRREGGQFDLDIPPEHFLKRATMSGGRGAEVPRPKSNVGRWIGGVVVVLIVIGLLRYGRYGWQYMNVPWKPFASPDGTFKTKFPEEPKESSSSHNINGDIWTIKSFLADYKNHSYAVQYVDLKTVVVEANAQSIMDRFFSGWVDVLGGKLESRENTSIARNPAIRFIVTVPAGSGPADEKLPVAARIRGFLALRGNRLFFVWGVAALADPFTKDIHQFTDAFETTAAERPAQLIVAEPPPTPAPAPPPPPAQAQPSQQDEQPAKAPTQAEIASRRAAEPQVYLEPAWKMYHVAGCPAVTPQMQRVAMEQLPYGYAPHVCVPDSVRMWRRLKSTRPAP